MSNKRELFSKVCEIVQRYFQRKEKSRPLFRRRARAQAEMELQQLFSKEAQDAK